MGVGDGREGYGSGSRMPKNIRNRIRNAEYRYINFDKSHPLIRSMKKTRVMGRNNFGPSWRFLSAFSEFLEIKSS
jgi:hypothetical protein